MVNSSCHTIRNFHATRVAFVFIRFMFPLSVSSMTLPMALIVVLSAIFISPVVVASPAPVVDAAAQGQALQKRIKRIETRLENQGLVDLMSRFDQLQRDMQRIIGDLEVQNHQLGVMKQQQKKLYTDIDRRLGKLEQGAKSGASSAPGSGKVSVRPASVGSAGNVGGLAKPLSGSPQSVSTSRSNVGRGSMSEVERNVARSAYERAFNLLKQRRYSLAIASFKAFLETYPYASYADNAQYWLGEANYANKKYKLALGEFQKVISNFPNSPKRADAMLKIGYTYVELGNKKKAMNTLNTIVSSYPGSTAARLAQKRIKALNIKR